MVARRHQSDCLSRKRELWEKLTFSPAAGMVCERGDRIMTCFHKALFACGIATAIVCGAVSTPTPARAAKVSNADKAALRRAIVACEAKARGRNIRRLSRRRYVNNCVTEAMRDRPYMHIMTLLKEHPNLTDLPVENWPGF